MTRSTFQQLKDFLTFPIRAITLFEKDILGLTSLRSERFYYCAKEVKGYCLDIGCGKYNIFIDDFLNKNGKGIDVYPYEGLTPKNIVKDMTKLPFRSATFDSVTFIANINHIPRNLRDKELKEAYRCLRESGNVIVTMGNPIAEILVHRLVHFYDSYLHTNVDMDSERGMHEHENYFLTDKEIVQRLKRAGFRNIEKKYFITQWGLNHLFIGWK